ncbi:hypothetical protein H8356DRAFT_1725681 [Neocallimastix lanati (nom. inval.)]|nr:hypothetical protein H8356DRAFT_1725681 [Neocallimastix sp. JGI-2020a]
MRRKKLKLGKNVKKKLKNVFIIMILMLLKTIIMKIMIMKIMQKLPHQIHQFLLMQRKVIVLMILIKQMAKMVKKIF